MDIYEFYQKVAVRVRCTRNNGSGCLYQPNTQEYSYVLTAKHCLIGKRGEENSFQKEDIEVWGSTELNGGQKLKVINYLLHDYLDIAIIIIEFISNLPTYVSAAPEPHGAVILNGYPEFMSGDRKSLIFKVHECPKNKPTFEIIEPYGQLINYGNSETDLVEGFSGSAVFSERDGYPILNGIFPAFKADEGAYHALEVIKAEEFNKILEENCWAQLVPSYLSSFKDHISPAFEHRSENIALLLSQKAEELEKITPLMIKELLNEKLVLPYGNSNLDDPNLWIGWIILLTYLYIETGRDELPSLLERNKNGQRQSVKFFYSHTHKRLEDLFKIIINDKKIYNDIGGSDCVVVNHEGRSGEVLKLSKSKMDKIVTDIGVYKLKFIHKIPRIDQHTVSKNISLLHIDCFTDEFRKHVEIEDFEQLEEKLRVSITEVLNNG